MKSLQGLSHKAWSMCRKSLSLLTKKGKGAEDFNSIFVPGGEDLDKPIFKSWNAQGVALGGGGGMLKLQINRRIRVVIKTIKAEWPHYPNHSQSIMSPNKRSLDVIFRLRQNGLIANNLLHLYASVILRLQGVPESVNKQNSCLNSVQHKVCC